MKYRIIFNPAIAGGVEYGFEEEFETLEEARLVANSIANYTLHLHNLGLMSDHTNHMLIMQLVKDSDGIKYWEQVLDDE